MNFRQHNKNPHALWRKRVRPLLTAAGLPDAVADDDRRWGYLLDHGADEFNSGWSPRDMTPRQAADLLALGWEAVEEDEDRQVWPAAGSVQPPNA